MFVMDIRLVNRGLAVAGLADCVNALLANNEAPLEVPWTLLDKSSVFARLLEESDAWHEVERGSAFLLGVLLDVFVTVLGVVKVSAALLMSLVVPGGNHRFKDSIVFLEVLR